MTPPSRPTRRALLGASLSLASMAGAYAALGGPLLSGGGSQPDAEPEDQLPPLDSESVRIGHLLRRAGFGATREELDHYLAIGLDQTISELVDFQRFDDSASEVAADASMRLQGNRTNIGLWWLVRMATTRRPLQEKLTLFWHGLLTTQQSAIPDFEAIWAQNKMYRARAAGDFRDLLHGLLRDRAMMVYLDMDGSVKGSPNENFARELLELFTMGEGHYSEQDVREAARAFTGWKVPLDFDVPTQVFTLRQPEFEPERHDDGEKTFFRRSGRFGPEEIVDIALDQEPAAWFITRRLFEFFAYREPADETLEPLVATYQGSGRNIAAVVEAILRSEEFYSARAYRALVKSPVEYVVGTVKALGLANDLPRLLPSRSSAMRLMGQVLFEPPNVAGWPGQEIWLGSSMLLARLNFINLATGGQQPPLPGGRPPPATPTPAPELAAISSFGTARQALDHYLPLAFDGFLPRAMQEAITDFAGGPDTPLSAEQLRAVVYLVLASPHYHLA